MNTDTLGDTLDDSLGRIDTKVYTSTQGRAVIDQSQGASIVLSADQILAVIEQLHVCYDYCAAWKEPMQPVRHADAGDHPPCRID